jgi:hypothetical protein
MDKHLQEMLNLLESVRTKLVATNRAGDVYPSGEYEDITSSN